MWKKLLLRLTTAVLLLGLAGSLLYAGFYFYTTWHTDQLSARLSEQRSIAASAPSAEPTSTPPQAPASENPTVGPTATLAEARAASRDSSDVPSPARTEASGISAVPADTPNPATAEARSASRDSSDAPSPARTETSGISAVPTDTPNPATAEVRSASRDSSDVPNPARTEASGISAVPADTPNPATAEAGSASRDSSDAPNPARTEASGTSAVPADTPNPATAEVRAASAIPAAGAASPAPEVGNDPADDPLLAYYNALAEKNPDMIGWISIADTPVDYPVMYTPEEPQYYLNRDFDRKYTAEGMPFLDGRCDAAAPSDNLIVYGHNMRSGRMFGTLSRYRNEEYRQAHSLISFDTLTERRMYRLYAGFVIRLAGNEQDADTMCYRVDLTSDGEQLQALLDYASQHALFIDPEVEPRLQDQLLTLSTCTSVRRNERFVLMAVRVE